MTKNNKNLHEKKALAKDINVPWFAIGGIKKLNIPFLKKNGIKKVAIISALMNSEDPKEEAIIILKELSNED